MRSRISNLVSLNRYVILSTDVPSLVREVPHGVVFGTVTFDNLDGIEASRPGYSKTARSYLGAGHTGVTAWVGGQLVGMGWFRANVGSRTETLKGYFPVKPGECYFHADWTSPLHRRRGYHRAIVSERARIVSELPQVIRVVANIEPKNYASLRSYRALGFSDTGVLSVFRVWRWSWAKVSG